MQIYRQFLQTLPMHKYFVRNYFSSSLMIFNRYIWHHSLQIFPLVKTTFAIHNFQCTGGPRLVRFHLVRFPV